MDTDTITPLPHGPLRSAMEAGAVAVGMEAYHHADWLLSDGRTIRITAAGWLADQLAHYRNLCALAGIESQAHWVERITEAIERGQGS